MFEEFKRLSDKGSFNWKTVIEASKLRQEARDGKRKKVHIGLIFGLCVEKGHLLDKNDKRRKFKGRYVFQGSNVLDE